MKTRSPCKVSGTPKDDEKLKIIIRIRPTLNEEDPQNFVNLEDVPPTISRMILSKSKDQETTPT